MTMRIPLAPAGRREMLLMTLLVGLPGLAMLALAGRGSLWWWPAGGVLTMLWLGGLAFFRDPQRRIRCRPGELLAPADGRVTEVATLADHPEIGGPAVRTGIFLSVLDVHINRSPCAGTVRLVRYEPGAFLDARHPESGSRNEANTVVIDPDPPLAGPVVVRQVAGLIARRIVCSVGPGDRVEAGQRIGLIKFGSRTELIVPAAAYEQSAYVGTRCRAGLTVLACLRAAEDRPADRPARQEAARV